MCVLGQAEWASETQPPGTWPDAGRLQFDNYKVRYRPELDLVLNGISCDISSTEKVGRCGCGGLGVYMVVGGGGFLTKKLSH